MGERVSSLLRQSVEHLSNEVPASYRLVLDQLGPMIVQLDVDGEQFCLNGGQRLQVTDGAADGARAHITTSRDAILAVLDAKIGLGHAVEAGAVAVQGSLDDVQRAHDTLLAYVHAAVRAPSQPKLLAALRAGRP
jgi:hypothetical protein